MSRETDIQELIYRQLVLINRKLDQIVSREDSIEEDVEELLPTPSAVSATLQLIEN